MDINPEISGLNFCCLGHVLLGSLLQCSYTVLIDLLLFNDCNITIKKLLPDEKIKQFGDEIGLRECITVNHRCH